MKLVKFENEKRYVRDFINLPKKLYDSSENMENPNTVKKILLGTHPLSKYFKLDKFLVFDDNGKAVGRFCITTYEGDNTAYMGFFDVLMIMKSRSFFLIKCLFFVKIATTKKCKDL